MLRTVRFRDRRLSATSRVEPKLATSCPLRQAAASSPWPDRPASCSWATAKRCAAKLERDGVAKRLIDVAGVRQIRQRSVDELLLHELNRLMLHLV